MTPARVYEIPPIPKPRMTHGTKWRPAAQRYFKFKQMVQDAGVTLDVDRELVVFLIKAPKSKEHLIGKPHDRTPDVDNLLKSLFDAIYEDDSKLYRANAIKLWATRDAILIFDEGESFYDKFVDTLVEIGITEPPSQPNERESS